ncbi:deoxynucleoside kinase [Allomeiothermus silvanus DSM 9946]|uniref:Deoxynucleoside kinase n=1 Tax=Allomeiothermus silvanus (strain ATCC 700542 / DSM 9946 / NBRC 106475 / NCIMB 13440 / VI-R2) TaxID=526227 RepID=D7BAT3_ALLS1|nr:deoxynucleoside kinase [Allomeiothermus silvanus]ADH64307.1 deoxynucleoside kinase [Allomeiothermus silvanus DSM 9946]
MYIAIAGNIGSGKSSLTALMAEEYGFRPVYEAVDENPYLADFYADMGRWAFPSQVFFLAKRLKQHLEEVNRHVRVVQDRTVFEDAAIFACNLYRQGHLSERDWQTYQQLYEGIAPALRKPDLLIYIRASLPTLKKRIAKRGREYERGIPEEYLRTLNELYESWVQAYALSPKLVLEGDRLDFVESARDRLKLIRTLDKRVRNVRVVQGSLWSGG